MGVEPGANPAARAVAAGTGCYVRDRLADMPLFLPAEVSVDVAQTALRS